MSTVLLFYSQNDKITPGGLHDNRVIKGFNVLISKVRITWDENDPVSFLNMYFIHFAIKIFSAHFLHLFLSQLWDVKLSGPSSHTTSVLLRPDLFPLLIPTGSQTTLHFCGSATHAGIQQGQMPFHFLVFDRCTALSSVSPSPSTHMLPPPFCQLNWPFFSPSVLKNGRNWN